MTNPQPLAIHAWALQGLEWSGRSPQEGDRECTCMLCGEVIGAAEDDPRWKTHDPDCVGCALCEIAIRLFRVNGKASKEQRFHDACFRKILAPNPKLGPAEE